MKTTNLWIIIDEETLETVKDATGIVAKFETEEQADKYASSRLNIWMAFHINFKHEYLNHTL